MSNAKISADTVGASAGIGTLCVILAERLDPSSVLKDLLIFGAPSITLMSGWIWAAAKSQIFLIIDDYNSKKIIEKAQALVSDVKSRGANEKHVADLSEIMHSLERQKMETYKDRAKITFE